MGAECTPDRRGAKGSARRIVATRCGTTCAPARPLRPGERGRGVPPAGAASAPGAAGAPRAPPDSHTYRVRVRIALVSTPFVRLPPPAYGGTELVVDALVHALGRMGHEVSVFATGDSRAPRLRVVFERAVWPPDPYAELLHCRAAAREMRRGRFDVVHAHSPALLAFADELGAPLVYTLHHDANEALSRYYATVPAPVCRVAISARQAALASTPPFAVVHHGLEPAMYPELGAGGDAAFFVGRLSWVKAPDLAIDAARRAGLPIVVAGVAAPGRRAAGAGASGCSRRRCARRGVTWLPRVDLAGKRALFARARALLVPLRWEEPFGLVMIEALLAGCPVIASRARRRPRDRRARRGRVPRLAARTRWPRRCAPRRRSTGGAIQARARRRFSADRMAREYVAVYRAAGARGRTPLGAEGEWTQVELTPPGRRTCSATPIPPPSPRRPGSRSSS